MFKVIFTSQADEAYLAMLEYYYHFSIDYAIKLEEKLDELIGNLSRYKNFCPPSKNSSRLRRCVLTENVSLVYTVDGQTIWVVAVYDSRTDHLF